MALPAMVAAFGTYFCMYAFRKPFTAATYEQSPSLFGVDFKTVLVVSQVLGYMVSKFVGIRVVAEVRREQRVRSLLIQIGLAEVSLLLFALTPPPFNALWLFANGLALGMVFGLVMGFLEGRRSTEALIAALCVSFILADGAMKAVGAALLREGVAEAWMPCVAGLLFATPLVLCCGMLRRVPPPDPEDVAARAERAPMSAVDRRRYLRRYGPGLALIVLVYLLVTILRSVRADFAPEIWAGLGVVPEAGLFWQTEALVGGAILLANGSMVFVRNNRAAFFGALGLAGLGLALTLVAEEGLAAGVIPPFAFMVLLGLGLYLPYIAVHTTVFERFIAMTRDRGTVGFLMYLADAFGYLGYVAVLLVRQVSRPTEGILPFFLVLCAAAAVSGLALLVPAALYFRRIRSAA